MFTEDDLLPISSLQHLMFCERQWGLIHLEQVWEENRFTAEGRVMHDKVHEVDSEVRKDVRIARGLRVRCLRLGLSGQCDVVEFRNCGAGFQPAGPKQYKTAGKMPAPQQQAKLEQAGWKPAPHLAPHEGIEPHEILASVEPPLTLGSCVLKREDCARIVQDALVHFEGERYHLVAWCIMPNHVHVIVAPLDEHTLSGILHTWKSFTARKINGLIGLDGALWERESFDHLIRSMDDLERFKAYVEENPVAKGLCSDPRDWTFGSCGAGFQPAASFVFVPGTELPFLPLKSRGELPHLHKEGGTYFVTFRLLDAVVLKSEDAGWKPAPQGQDAGRMPAPQVPFPIEYKRGKPKLDRCDEVQLCAQALCLEEMLNVDVPAGALFYGKTRRRYEVAFDAALRLETDRLATRLHELYKSGVTPKAVYEKKCDSCSLFERCQPKTVACGKSARRYVARLVAAQAEDGAAP